MKLTLGIGPYDHVRDLVTGAVGDDRVDIRTAELPPEALFREVESGAGFDVAEFSLAKYVALRSRRVEDLVALPVFPSRVFRQGSFFVAVDSPLTDPRSLAGRRIGVPEWVQTAGVWARGWLSHDVAVPLASIRWYQGGVDEPGRRETVRFAAPQGVTVTPVRDRSLDELLQRGDLDAVLCARPPLSSMRDRPASRRLLMDHESAEAEYFRRTRLFPIMHVVVVRRHLTEAHPWLGDLLVDLFTEAKRRSAARLADHTASYVALPWAAQSSQKARELFGGDPFPYGVQASRTALDTFIGYCVEQGVAAGPVTVDELFR